VGSASSTTPVTSAITPRSRARRRRESSPWSPSRTRRSSSRPVRAPALSTFLDLPVDWSGSTPARPLERYAGHYVDATGTLGQLDVAFEEGHLVIDYPNGAPALRPPEFRFFFDGSSDRPAYVATAVGVGKRAQQRTLLCPAAPRSRATDWAAPRDRRPEPRRIRSPRWCCRWPAGSPDGLGAVRTPSPPGPPTARPPSARVAETAADATCSGNDATGCSNTRACCSHCRPAAALRPGQRGSGRPPSAAQKVFYVALSNPCPPRIA